MKQKDLGLERRLGPWALAVYDWQRALAPQNTRKRRGGLALDLSSDRHICTMAHAPAHNNNSNNKQRSMFKMSLGKNNISRTPVKF